MRYKSVLSEAKHGVEPEALVDPPLDIDPEYEAF